jgi:hypothetical protein
MAKTDNLITDKMLAAGTASVCGQMIPSNGRMNMNDTSPYTNTCIDLIQVMYERASSAGRGSIGPNFMISTDSNTEAEWIHRKMHRNLRRYLDQCLRDRIL